jgi:hypothetical protein
MDEVHRSRLVRLRRRSPIVTQLGLDPALRRFVAQLQAQLAIDAPRLLLIDRPTFAAQQHMDAPITIAHARLADLLMRCSRPACPGRRDL